LDLTIADLIPLIREADPVAAHRRVESWRGKWITFSGMVQTVMPQDDGALQADFSMNAMEGAEVHAFFTHPEQKKRVRGAQTGVHLSLEGRISDMTQRTLTADTSHIPQVFLDDCELR
jgi:hypothetical protein